MSKLEKRLTSALLLHKIGSWGAPIVMVDRIADFRPGEKGSIVTVKHVTFNEPYIEGHFVGNPVMPGVMIAEIFGQSCEYFSLFDEFCRVHERESGQALKKGDDLARVLATPDGEQLLVDVRRRSGGYLVAQDLKFKKVVYPGDTIYVECSPVFADANGFHHYKVEARVGRYVVSEGKVVNLRGSREKAAAMGNSSLEQ